MCWAPLGYEGCAPRQKLRGVSVKDKKSMEERCSVRGPECPKAMRDCLRLARGFPVQPTISNFQA